ncbi:MAG TPA: hypothetical protein VGJ94_18495 [Syntrophorhabdaceae bacterium]|jgi:predicted HTH transcriptional regulator
METHDTKMGMGTMQDMMQNMMKGMGGMPDMCTKMMQQMMGSNSDASSLATPEIKGLFEEWVRTLEEEILAFVNEKGKTTPSELAAKLKISEDSTLFFVGKMARERKLTVGEIGVGA